MAHKPSKQDDDEEDDKTDKTEPGDKPSGMKIRLITSFRRKDGRHFRPDSVVEATVAEVKLLVGGGYATIAKDDEAPTPIPEPDP